MSVLVVHESHFGNSRAVAEAVGAGITDGVGADGGVVVVDVTEAPDALPDDLDLLVVGGPTHAFSMSRAATRHDALSQGAEPGHEARGIREWLAAVAPSGVRPDVATFDTRVTKVRRLPGSAARAAGRSVAKHHLGTLVDSASFFVEDSPGPLAPGELDRARAWGRRLATRRE
ncbi:flavodoxin [Nocardioides flavus (ex Wang et al. 2016)]|uniref:Flavodoxin n=1 Tax=Nocardioides flavus (ex Wang et al. 2016) TaxID=2058780 RepID=A0ABQ3HMT9_9ACTN|nr:flavodoxin/nitric oxide synthase [Nocardioides flavus (ex Wang et al. 2016)]GHE19002.1 flavodoxin [Nocardioides flavus (ex Wang et al. 2016)]